MKIFEGGNVFKDADGHALTQRINQTDVKSTIAWLEMMLPGLDLQNNTLGSTGIKDTSGDLDIAIDATKLSKDQLESQLVRWAQSHGLKPQEWIKKTGSAVHFKTPINGRPKDGFVQTDFMFLTDVPWSKFVLGAMPADSQYKGRERNVLMNSIAKSMGYKLNQIAGIADRETNKILSNDPDKVAKMLLNKSATKEDLASVESIMASLAKDSQRDAKLADFKAHMEREGLPFLEETMESTDSNPYKEVGDVYFLARLRDRIINQGMVALVEEAQPVGGRAKGIEHIEDLVFRNGTRGIQSALAVIDHMKDNTSTSTTVKWDGKPALIFGRLKDGTFVLTDVAGFTAKGYDGLFTSPRQVTKHLAARDADAAAKGKPATRVEQLAPLYQQLWPMLQAAVPENFKGFIQGDLLYTSTPSEQAGNLVFQPNTIQYNIPAASKLGQEIADSEVGIAIHTRYKEPGGAKEPLGRPRLNAVPGLLLLEPIAPSENVKPADSKAVKQLKSLVSKHGRDIDGLFNPAELRAAKITDLPKLCIDYVNSIIHRTGNDNKVIDNFVASDQFVGDFLNYVAVTKGRSKYQNIAEYLQSPRSNVEGIAAAWTAFILLHNIKMDILQQLDRQVPGQEGWVVTIPGGMVKFVNRFEFTRANRAINP
jgi:hypothetical protein